MADVACLESRVPERYAIILECRHLVGGARASRPHSVSPLPLGEGLGERVCGRASPSPLSPLPEGGANKQSLQRRMIMMDARFHSQIHLSVRAVPALYFGRERKS